MANPLNLDKFKKVKVEKDHTVLRHPQGHEIRILHKSVSPEVRKKLDALPHFDEGGKVEKPESGVLTDLSNKFKASFGEPPPPKPSLDEKYEAIRKQNSRNFGRNYADGGQVTPAPAPVVSAQESMRKAFHFSEGGKAQAHAHLSEAVKNLSMHFADGGAPDTTTITSDPNQPAIPDANMLAQQAPPTASLAPVQPQAPVEKPGSMPGGTLPEQAQKLTEREVRDTMAIGRNTAAGEKEKAQVYANEAMDLNELNDKYKAHLDQVHTQWQHTADEVAKTKIDPNHYWNSKSTGSKILTGIGMLIAGAGGGLAGNPTAATDIINKFIDRDIAAQKANLENKNSLLSKYMDMYQSLPAAEAATRLTLGAMTEGMLNQAAAKTNSPNALLAAKVAGSQLRQKYVSSAKQLAQDQVMKQAFDQVGKEGPSSDPAARLRQLGMTGQITPQQQTEALKELGHHQDFTRQKESIINAFDKADSENTIVGRVGRLGSEPPSVGAFQTLLMPYLKDAEGRISEVELARSDKLIPKPGDKPDTIAQKKEALINFLNEKSASPTLDSLGLTPKEGGSSNTQVSEAMQWLKANPNDPRAPAIRKKLGL